MSTFLDLANAVRLELNGFSQTVDQSSQLVNSITSGDLSISVGDGTQFSRGVVQIDSELIYVSGVDQGSGILTIPAYGRGYLGTTAVSHTAGVEVINTPTVPRAYVQRAINETIQSIYPTVYAVGTGTTTYIAGEYGYAVDPSADVILQVSWLDPISLEYVPIRRWRFDSQYDTLYVYDAVAPGRSIYWTYRKKPTTLSADTDVFATVTGLPASCEDVVRFGAVWRVLPYLEAQNSAMIAAEADYAARRYSNATGSAQLGQMVYQKFQIRLAEEGFKLNQQYPIRAHYTT